MELHHIVPQSDGGKNTFDNCIPLCFDCHADVMAYNPSHPKGRKYTASELRTHRNRWYSVMGKASAAQTQKAVPQALDTPPSHSQTADSLARRTPEAIASGTKTDIPNEPDCAVIRDSSRHIDYVHSTSIEFEQELVALNKQVQLIIQEIASARALGLHGSAEAAESEMQSIQKQIQILEKRIGIIEQGYEFWDKVGFEMACESYFFQCRWYFLGAVCDDGGFAFGDDLQIRVPLEAQTALKVAIDSRLFKEFLVCEALDYPIEILDSESSDYIESIEKGDYYLFGSSPWSNYDMYYISHWEENYT